MRKALFILKLREDYNDLCNYNDLCYNHINYHEVATGMYNSAKFISDELVNSEIESKVITVIDNNFIDKAVHDYKPTHVFIEGFWVEPEKFIVLKRLHPHVKWIVRCHSELPFLAQEGIAIDWLFKYLKNGVMIAGNSHRINDELRILAQEAGFGWSREKIEHHIQLLTNYYSTRHHHQKFDESEHEPKEAFDIGCFGAIRPLKNHLLQAIAAIDFARKHNKQLRFHINSGRIEMNGANVLKNLKALFQHTTHELVEHCWTNHHDFLSTIGDMDISMQVSFSETFNIISADAVVMHRPIIVSKEVEWAYPLYADPTSSKDITEAMAEIWKNQSFYTEANLKLLKKFSERSIERWIKFLNN